MTNVRFSDLRARIRARKAEFGIENTPELTEALRNKGGRTLAKRELLKRIEGRARAAGLEPIKSHCGEP